MAAAPSTTIGRIGGNVPVHPARPPLSLSDRSRIFGVDHQNNLWRDSRPPHRPQLAALSDGPVRGGATSGRPKRPRMSLSDGFSDLAKKVYYDSERPNRPRLAMSDGALIGGDGGHRLGRPNSPALAMSDRSYGEWHSKVVGPKKVRLAMGDAQLIPKRPLPAEATVARHWRLFADGEAQVSPKRPLLATKNPKSLSDARLGPKVPPLAEATSGGFNIKFPELFKFPKLFADDADVDVDVDVDVEALQLDEMKKDMKKKMVGEHKKRQKKRQHGKRGKKIVIKRRRN